jgi:hypothetical protein
MKILAPVFGGRALCALGLLALAASSPAPAQRARRTTPGRLLASRTDTIEVERRGGGETGATGARLRLTRTDSGFVGLLRLSAYHSDPRYSIPPRQCDTAMTSFMPRAVAERLLTLVESTVIEVGTPPPLPRVYDVWRHDTFRLSGRNGAVVIRDARAVEHRDTLYHVRFRTVRTNRGAVRGSYAEEPTPLMQADRMLDAYMRREQLEKFSRACG